MSRSAVLSAGCTVKPSVLSIVEQFSLSNDAQQQIREAFSRDALYSDNFQFVPAEFSKHLAFKTVELNNGGLLTASTERFDEVFQREVVNKVANVVKFTTQGTVVDQRLRKSK